ncbi:MAG TPA: molybdopterin-dependent oxidoreductase, partial [Longimicrobiales bacterium]|nr:molybdopterin-dependent oxidoreductase [Longimicrobiales bacterium]
MPTSETPLSRLFAALKGHRRPEPERVAPSEGGFGLPRFAESERRPKQVDLTTVVHPDGRTSQYPPPEEWEDWVEWDGKEWPRRVARRYTLVPTVCFNCESACGLLAYVDRETLAVRKFEGNPAHPGSRGRNCAKGPATINQVYDPERILHPLKRVGARGEGKWKRVGWDEALDEIAARMRESRKRRRDGIMYHVGRPGEDGFTNRCVRAWGVDGHNSHTNVCSAGSRAGYCFWSGDDRPSPDHANARVILLLSAHLETGHYFNPHAQRIMEGKERGAKIITLDPRLSNTASKSDVWLPTWPGSECTVLLAFARHLIVNDLYDRDFVRRWVNWEETLEHFASGAQAEVEFELGGERPGFEDFHRLLLRLYRDFTLERAARESRVPLERLREAAEIVGGAGGRLASHVWRGASAGNLGGWQVA